MYFLCLVVKWTTRITDGILIINYLTYNFVFFQVMVGQIQRGESILIHAGSGGVGQAAINVALHYGCEVFTTVGTAEKRAFIKKLFPQLKGTLTSSF